MLDNAVQNALGLGNLRRGPDIKYENAVEHTEFDLELYDDIKVLSPAVSQTVEDGEKKLKTFPNLSEDFFMSLYKFNPAIRDENDMLPSRSFNYNLLKELQDTPEFAKLRELCSLNLLNSAIGTEALHNSAIVKIDAIVEEYKVKLRQAKANGVPADQLPQNIINQLNKMAAAENKGAMPAGDQADPNDPFDFGNNSGGDGGMQLSNSAAKAVANMQNNIQQSPQLQQAQQEAQQQIKEALRQTAKQALDDVKEMDQFIDSWGLEGSSENRVPMDECKRALERIRNSKQLKEFTKLLGRFRNIAKTNLKKKSKEDGIALKNVETGSKIAKLLPTEKALLANDVTKPLFRKKFNENQLLQYQTESTKRKGMGPLVVCMDRSGSMSSDKIKWAKAVALALLEVALKQRRNYYFISFTGSIDYEYEILKGCANPNTIIDIAQIGAGGGTDFNVPVKRAVKIIRGSNDFKKADICFITDGDCDLSDDVEADLEKARTATNLKVQTVIINEGGHCSRGSVDRWSDSVIEVSKLGDLNDQLASDLFNFAIDEDDTPKATN